MKPIEGSTGMMWRSLEIILLNMEAVIYGSPLNHSIWQVVGVATLF